jgi:putative tricarboxylic transport membrane protein
MLGVGLSAIVMVPIGLYGGRLLARFVGKLQVCYLVPGIAILTIIGSYAIRNNFLDVILMLVFGFIGFGLRRLSFSAAPIVLGLILGPLMETGLVRAKLMGMAYASPWFALFVNPLSWILIALCGFSFLWPYFGSMKERLQGSLKE